MGIPSIDRHRHGATMQARNDALIFGPAFVAAMRRVLPKPGRVIRGSMTISPAGPGMVCLAYGPSQEDIPAAGIWSDTIAASAVHLAAIARQRPARDVRLIFHGTALAVNGTTLSATAIGTHGTAPAPEPPQPPLMDLPLFAYRWRRPGGAM